MREMRKPGPGKLSDQCNSLGQSQVSDPKAVLGLSACEVPTSPSGLGVGGGQVRMLLRLSLTGPDLLLSLSEQVSAF